MNTHLFLASLAPSTFAYSDDSLVYQAVLPYLEAGQKVHIDFRGTGGLSSSFLHGFLGEAFDLFGLEKVKELVKMVNLTGVQAQILRDYAAQYLALQNCV